LVEHDHPSDRLGDGLEDGQLELVEHNDTSGQLKNSQI
jgi:hypothetical protein